MRELLVGYPARIHCVSVLYDRRQVAGSFVDLQMGFVIVNVIDSVTGAQSPDLGQLQVLRGGISVFGDERTSLFDHRDYGELQLDPRWTMRCFPDCMMAVYPVSD